VCGRQRDRRIRRTYFSRHSECNEEARSNEEPWIHRIFLTRQLYLVPQVRLCLTRCCAQLHETCSLPIIPTRRVIHRKSSTGTRQYACSLSMVNDGHGMSCFARDEGGPMARVGLPANRDAHSFSTGGPFYAAEDVPCSDYCWLHYVLCTLVGVGTAILPNCRFEPPVVARRRCASDVQKVETPVRLNADTAVLRDLISRLPCVSRGDAPSAWKAGSRPPAAAKYNGDGKPHLLWTVPKRKDPGLPALECGRVRARPMVAGEVERRTKCRGSVMHQLPSTVCGIEGRSPRHSLWLVLRRARRWPAV